MSFTRCAALAAVFMLSGTASFAQTKTLEGIGGMRRSALSPIYAGNEVKGYLMFGRGEKVDALYDNYLLDFYDQDLGKISNITLQKPAGQVHLLSNTFNGSAFAFYFFNTQDGTLEMDTYDTGLKMLGGRLITNLSNADKYMGVSQLVGGMWGGGMLGRGLSLLPVPGQGFVRNSYKGQGEGYALEMYSDDLTVKWRLASDERAGSCEALSLTEAGEKYVLGIMLRRSSLTSKLVSSCMVAVDVATGKKVLDLPVETNKNEQLSLSSFTFDAEKHQFVAVGEYYQLDEKPFVHKSVGFFVKRFSEAGQVVSVKYYGWGHEVMALMPTEARPSLDDKYVNYTHSIVKGANGRLYIVAEQFKIVANGKGIALTMLGQEASAMKGKIGNLFVFELDPEDKLSSVKFYPKEVSDAELPSGSGFIGPGLLGQLMKSQGDFDYQFIQRDDASTRFNVVYLSADKEQGNAAKKRVSNIAFGDNGKYTVDKVDFNASSSYSYVYPAKPGYVLIADYFKKKSQLGMKLVKLNN